MKFYAIALLFAAVTVASVFAETDEEAFKAFQKENGKRYRSSKKEQTAFANFRNARSSVNAHNAEFKAGLQTYERAVYSFHDLDFETLESQMTGLVLPENFKRATADSNEVETEKRQSASSDWTKFGTVKHQGSCGSCWAFTAIGALETSLAIQGKKANLSEQEIVDCVRTGCNGCNGGWYTYPINYAKTQGGINTAAAYPYAGVQSTCRSAVSKNFGFKTNGAVQIAASDAAICAAAAKGPVMVAVYADNAFMSYRSGLFQGSSNPVNPNHAVLLVGCSPSFYKIRNSWGTGWGEGGYIRMARNGRDNAGVISFGVQASF